MCVGELHRPVYGNRVATHHLMDHFFSKVSHPDRRSSRSSVHFCSIRVSSRDVLCVVHTYILTSQLGSADRFPTDPVSSLYFICTDLTGSTKGGSIMRKIPEHATVQERKGKGKRKRKERHFFLRGGGIQISGTILPHINHPEPHPEHPLCFTQPSPENVHM